MSVDCAGACGPGFPHVHDLGLYIIILLLLYTYTPTLSKLPMQSRTMSLAIANAHDQCVLLHNSTTKKWENIAGNGKTCKVRVVKQSEGDHLLRITPDGGQVRSALSLSLLLLLKFSHLYKE